MKNRLPIICCCCTASLAILAGCKSPPAAESVYIPPEYAKLMQTREDLPGPKAWGRPALIREYDKIKIAVVISPKQIEESWWGGQNIRNAVSSKEDDLRYVAEYAVKAYHEAFAKCKHLKLTDKAGPKTLALEFAIVQVVPGKPVLGAVSNLSTLTPIGLVTVPIKLAHKGSGSDTGGAIAMECILRDSQTGEVLAAFSDREKGKTAIFNAKEFTAYANIRAIIGNWAAQTVTALDQIKEGKKVSLKTESNFVPVDY